MNYNVPAITVQIPEIKVPDVTVNVPAPVVNVNVPEQQAPVVNVSVPEQQSPIINVTNQVNPTPVNIENRVESKVDPLTRVIVRRDKNGKIDELIEKEIKE